MIFYDLSKHSAQRFADAANRNGLQLLVLLHIVADVRRDDTPPESQPRDLRQALVQMIYRTHLAGQSDFSNRRQIRTYGQILKA